MLKHLRRIAAANPSTAATLVVVGGILAVITEWILASKLWMFMVGPSAGHAWQVELLLGGLIGNMIIALVGGITVWAGVGIYEVWTSVRKQIRMRGE